MVGIGFICDKSLLLTILTMCLQFAIKIIVEEEVAVERSCHYKIEVCDLGQHYHVKISAPHNRCTALKYAI